MIQGHTTTKIQKTEKNEQASSGLLWQTPNFFRKPSYPLGRLLRRTRCLQRPGRSIHGVINEGFIRISISQSTIGQSDNRNQNQDRCRSERERTDTTVFLRLSANVERRKLDLEFRLVLGKGSLRLTNKRMVQCETIGFLTSDSLYEVLLEMTHQRLKDDTTESSICQVTIPISRDATLCLCHFHQVLVRE